MGFDQNVIVAATDFTRSHAGFRSFVEIWETISQPFVMYLFLGLPVSLYVWFGRHLRTRAWWGLATMAAGWAIAALLKLLVRRARPEIDDPFAQHAGYSFPSGHATNNAIVITVVVLMLWPLVGHRSAAPAGRHRRGVGSPDLCRPALRRRPLPLRRRRRRTAGMWAGDSLLRRLHGLAPADPRHRHNERLSLMAF